MKVKKTAIAITMALLAIACIGVEYYTVSMFFKARQAESWPTADGVVENSEVVQLAGGELRFEAQVTYGYSVDGKPCQSDVVRLRGTIREDRSEAQEIASRYPGEAKVKVYHNPDDSSDAVLEPGVDFVNYLIIVTPILFGALFAFTAHAVWQDRNEVTA